MLMPCPQCGRREYLSHNGFTTDTGHIRCVWCGYETPAMANNALLEYWNTIPRITSTTSSSPRGRQC